ncbi:MAG TPA: hypothetical protein VNK48_14360 [Xanthobacteraceae bacterium]|nr:hypothetical protein [Xanthobacteraceae bacterium]
MICTYCGQMGHTAAHCPRRRGYAVAWSVLAIMLGVLMAACASLPAKPSGIRPPAARLMAPPKPLPTVKAGDDLVEKYIELAEDAAEDKARLKSLQGYVRTLRGK